MLSHWESNPYDTESDDKEPLSDLSYLLDNHWQTQGNAQDNMISIILGRLEKDGFAFKYPQGWGMWPVDYLKSVISHSYTRNAVFSQFKIDSDKRRRERNKTEVVNSFIDKDAQALISNNAVRSSEMSSALVNIPGLVM